MKTVAVIMAGGRGDRFWPKSRASLPKQFLTLTEDKKIMIQITAERILPLIDYDDIFVVTNKDYIDLVKTQLPEIPVENILAEPAAKNTAPCIAFAAAVISRKYNDATMLVLSSDHLIKNNDIFIDTLIKAINAANESNSLVTLGIIPSYPETGYGYINYNKAEHSSDGVYKVSQFVEKPDADTARAYLESGQYLWNSGMFVWKLSAILQKFKELLPDIYSSLLKIRESFGTPDYQQILDDSFAGFKPVSIDFGIMEKADNIYTIPCNFGWSDVGSWLALKDFYQVNENGNLVQGDIITIDTENSTIIGNRKLIATIGVNDLIVVDTEDALLICSANSAQDIKKIVNILKENNRLELL